MKMVTCFPNNDMIVGIPTLKEFEVRREPSPKRKVDELDTWIDTLGLWRKSTSRDGSSFYRILAEHFHLSQSKHLSVRKKVVDYMRDHKTEFEEFVDGDYEDHLQRCERPKEFASQSEVLAASSCFQCDIIVYQEHGKPPINLSNKHFPRQITMTLRNGCRFDPVFTKRHKESCSVVQAVLFDVLYEKVFGLPRRELDEAVHTLRAKYAKSKGWWKPNDCPSPALSTESEGSIGSRAAEFPADTLDPEQVPLRLPFRVAKALDPDFYRNIEFDVYNDDRRAEEASDIEAISSSPFFERKMYSPEWNRSIQTSPVENPGGLVYCVQAPLPTSLPTFPAPHVIEQNYRSVVPDRNLIQATTPVMTMMPGTVPPVSPLSPMTPMTPALNNDPQGMFNRPMMPVQMCRMPPPPLNPPPSDQYPQPCAPAAMVPVTDSNGNAVYMNVVESGALVHPMHVAGGVPPPPPPPPPAPFVQPGPVVPQHMAVVPSGGMVPMSAGPAIASLPPQIPPSPHMYSSAQVYSPSHAYSPPQIYQSFPVPMSRMPPPPQACSMPQGFYPEMMVPPPTYLPPPNVGVMQNQPAQPSLPTPVFPQPAQPTPVVEEKEPEASSATDSNIETSAT